MPAIPAEAEPAIRAGSCVRVKRIRVAGGRRR